MQVLGVVRERQETKITVEHHCSWVCINYDKGACYIGSSRALDSIREQCLSQALLPVS